MTESNSKNKDDFSIFNYLDFFLFMSDYTAKELPTECLILKCKWFWNLLVTFMMHFLKKRKASSGKDCALTEVGETLKGKVVCFFQ